jgi:hypothetical protein
MQRSVVPKSTDSHRLLLIRSLQIILNALVVLMVQCFFIRRIWVLSGRKHWVAISLSAIALAVLSGAMFFAVKDIGHQLFSRYHGVCRVSPFLDDLRNRCRLFLDPYRMAGFRYDTRWRNCRAALVLSPQGMPSSRSRHWLITQVTSSGAVSRAQTASSTILLCLPLAPVLLLSRHRQDTLFSFLHRQTQAYIWPSILWSQSYSPTLSMHL